MDFDLDELERLEREATPGPWCYDERGPCISVDEEDGDIVIDLHALSEPDGDTDLVIALRNAAPDLFAEIRRLREENARLRSVMGAAAAEIEERWDAHCDETGAVPVNLLRRLKTGTAVEYPSFMPGAEEVR